MKSKIHKILNFGVMIGISAFPAYSAMLSGSFGTITSGTPSPANLTDLGTVDWRIWNGPAASTNPLYNEKAGGTAISNLTTTFGAITDTNTAQSSAQPYAYTDGVSPTTEVNSGARSVEMEGTFSQYTSGGTTSYNFTVDPLNTEEHTVTIYGGHRYMGSTITLSLNGATTVIDSTNVPGNTFRYDWVYTATFTPDNANDLLSVAISAGTGSQSPTDNRNGLYMGAVGVSAIPEPSTLIMVLSFGLGILALRRRR